MSAEIEVRDACPAPSSCRWRCATDALHIAVAAFHATRPVEDDYPEFSGYAKALAEHEVQLECLWIVRDAVMDKAMRLEGEERKGR